MDEQKPRELRKTVIIERSRFSMTNYADLLFTRPVDKPDYYVSRYEWRRFYGPCGGKGNVELIEIKLEATLTPIPQAYNERQYVWESQVE